MELCEIKKILDHKESSEVLYNKNWSFKETQEMEEREESTQPTIESIRQMRSSWRKISH